DKDAVSKEGVERPWLSEAKGFILTNHDTGRILTPKSQRNIIDPLVVVIDSLATDYDLADESSVCSTLLPTLKKLDGAEPISKSKTIKLILSTVHTTSDHNDIEWFRRGEASQSKNVETPKLKRPEASNATRSKTPTQSGCSRHMTGVKSYLHKYVEQPGPKVVFRDDSTCITEGYGSIKCNGIFDEKRGSIFNSNKEIFMIAPRVRDVYVLDMTSPEQESCFFARATENLNWLWHKRLAHLNFKTINQLAKQNLVMGLPSLVYSKDKPCSSCEKGKHHRASFKTKQIFSVKKCLHLLHMDLFRHVTPRSINHEKYTLVIFDEYSRISILVNFGDEKGFLKNFPLHIHLNKMMSLKGKNRTLIEAARTMLSGSVFSKQYWNEVHKDYLGKFDEKADDGYFLRYSIVSKAFRVFNTRKQQTKETYHITFDESIDAIKFTKPLVDNLNITDSMRYPPDEFLHHYEPSQKYQINNNEENDFQNDDHPKHSNHNNDSPIIETLNTKVVQDSSPIIENIINTDVTQDSELTSSPVEDTSIHNTIPNIPPSSIPSTLFRCSRQCLKKNNMERVNIIGYLRARMLTRAIDKTLSAASSHECLFVDFLSEEEPKKIKQSERGISINQEKYVKDLLKKYDINGSSVKTPMVPPNNLRPDLNGKSINETQFRGMIGSLMYLSANRPNIQFLTCLYKRHQANPNKSHLIASAKKKQYVAMSSAEAEYVAAAGCCANIFWMKSQLTNYDIIYEKVPIFCDNTSAIAISNNLVMHSRTKYIDIRYHFIRDHILKGDIEMNFIPTQYQLVVSLQSL
ncbi:retrovirus-related pol polyprotein from transposon TNT 1-94, partial [Tanacetum coccineum]